MASLNPSPANCRSNRGLNPSPENCSDDIRVYIQVPDGFMRFGVDMPSNSNFGNLRSSIFNVTGRFPREYKLFFGGLEKEDDEDLQAAGVVNNSEVQLLNFDDLADPEISCLIGVTIPSQKPATIYVQVIDGPIRFGVDIPPHSKFGYLKSKISANITLRLREFGLFFGGVEKGDDEDLQEAGVINKSEVLLIEYIDSEEETFSLEEEGSVHPCVDKVRIKVDKLVEKVSALEDVVESGNKVDEKEISYLTKKFMRQLYVLENNIYVHGKAWEVYRAHKFVNKLDDLKSRNSK